MPRRRHLGALALSAAALLLAACSGDEPGPRPTCPRAATLQDAARLVAFQGSGRDLTDVRYQARITNVRLGCRYVQPDEGQRTLEAEMQVEFLAEKGPANTEGRAPFTYFVAITDRERNVLAREAFDAAIPLQGNQTRVRAVETLSPTIPLPEGASGGDYRLYVGFELTESQLEYNRRNPL